MKQLLGLFIAMNLIMPSYAVSVSGGTCDTISERQMETMSAEALIFETCKAQSAVTENMRELVEDAKSKGSDKQFPNANENLRQCNDQVTNMLSMLAAKGVSGPLYKLCKKTSQN